MVAAGSVLALAGGVAVAAGAVRLTVSATCPGLCPDPARNEAIGAVAIGAGAAVLAGGVVLIVLGTRPRAPAAAWLGAPGGAGWTWRF